MIHKQAGSKLGGVHFELTGDRVTEVVGGSMELTEEELSSNYQTFCDPRYFGISLLTIVLIARLNYEQSLDVAFMLAEYFKSV